MIRQVYDQAGLVLDPHTAVGVGVGRELRNDRDIPLVMLACAHPAKFPETVKAALGEGPIEPDRIRALAGLSERVDVLPNDLEAVQSFINQKTGDG